MAKTIKIPYQPRPQQRETHKELTRFRYGVLVCHRRFGKTVMAINQLLRSCLTLDNRAPRYAYIAPLYKQAKQVAWDYLKHYSAPVPGVKINESELRIDYPNGGRITLYGADNPDSLRGIYLDGVVIDEPAQCPPNLYGEILRPALSDRKGWALWIGTPKGHDHFYELYRTAKASSEWYAHIYRASETELIDYEELETARRQMTDAQYLQEFECSFDVSGDESLIPIQLVESAFDRNIGYHFAEKVMGVDVGMSLTGDPSSIVLRQGGAITHMEEFRLDDTLAIAGRVKERFNEYQPHSIVIDAIGWGAGVAHTLQGWGLPVIALNVGERAAENEKFANCRAELWWRLRDFFADKQCSIHESDMRDKLAVELSMPQYGYTPAGKVKLESKDDMKKRGFESPNIGDALAMTMHIKAAPHIPDSIFEFEDTGKSVFC